MKEIEYTFLVDREKWQQLEKPDPVVIKQGFLRADKTCTVRVRVKGNRGYLTIKGPTKGITREEFDYPIPVDEANFMLESFTNRHMVKLRYQINVSGFIWEVDEFQGELSDLILAELEVENESIDFQLPDWVSKDVSADPNYYNAVLIERIPVRR